ncbi:MAG: type II secretion system F family protein, partial [bacterium]
KIDIPPMTQATMDLSQFLQNYFLILLALILIPFIIFVKWARTEKGRYLIDRTLIKLPFIGQILHKTSIEIFGRVFHALYSSSGENIQAIRIAAESCRNKYIDRQIVGIVVPRMLKEGKSFVECLSRANCFTLNAIRRLRSGEESGTLRESALQLANYYEKETSHKMKRFMDLINLSIAIVLTIMIIALTLVSSEIGFVSPPSPLTR